MYIKYLKSLFGQFKCGLCYRCFKHTSHLGRHTKICDGTLIKHIWKEGVYEPKSDIKKCLESFGIDTGTHDFLFPCLVVYNMKASLPPTPIEPAVK